MSEQIKGSQDKYCVECGAIINLKAEICPKCGVRQPGTGFSNVVLSRRVISALFAILLGTFGVHKFYLGKVGQGILYALFFWTGIPAVVGIIEGILYLTMSDETFEQKYSI